MFTRLARQLVLFASACIFVLVPPFSLIAQQTVTTDAGAGFKQHVEYDSMHRVIQSTTTDPDGKLSSRVSYTYGPQSQVMQRVTASFWPDGKPHASTATHYDENANFTLEVVEEFDPTGIHIRGHQVLHDPVTGVVRCFDWVTAKNKYIAIECPAGEEAHEGLKVERKLTRDQVLQLLASARQALSNSGSVPPSDLGPNHPVSELGLLLPASLSPGRKVSGSLVLDPQSYEGIPGLLVHRIPLPPNSSSDAAWFSHLAVDVPGGATQPATAALTLNVPAAKSFEIVLHDPGNPSAPIRVTVDLPKPEAKASVRPSGYLVPALCFKRSVCVVSGAFSGDSRATLVAFEGVPVRILAEGDSMAFAEVPESILIGPSAMLIAEGGTVAAAIMVVANAQIAPNREAVDAGHDFATTLRVSGVSELSGAQWTHGDYPSGSLEQARAFVPGFNPRKTAEAIRERNEKQQKRDGLTRKEEKWEESAGMVLVIVRNLAPEVGNLRGSTQQQFVFNLTPDSFERGDFVYNMSVDAAKDGVVSLRSLAIPFLAPIKAQVFDSATQPRN